MSMTELVPQPILTPEKVVEEAKHKAVILKGILDARPKKVMFNGQRFAVYEDWQTLGRFYGLIPKVEWTHPLDDGFEARAIAVNIETGTEISAAESQCTRDERNWEDKPDFQLRSMAQTRACAKALRNALGWVMVLAGIEATPAEELEGERTSDTTRRARTVQPPQARQASGQPRRVFGELNAEAIMQRGTEWWGDQVYAKLNEAFVAIGLTGMPDSISKLDASYLTPLHEQMLKMQPVEVKDGSVESVPTEDAPLPQETANR